PQISAPSLPSTRPPKLLPITSPVQPASSACPPSLSCLQSRPHHGGMASAKVLQNRIVFKGEGVLIVQSRFGAGRRITVVDLGLLLLLRQHNFRVLDPPIVKDPRARECKPLPRPALKIPPVRF